MVVGGTRFFQVIVSKLRKVSVHEVSEINRIVYPVMEIVETIKLMQTLKGRDFDSIAYTRANEIEENLTLEELILIKGE